MLQAGSTYGRHGLEALENRTFLSISKLDFAAAFQVGGTATVDLQVDRQGYVYLLGYFTGQVDLNLTPTGTQWIRAGQPGAHFIAKYNPDGVPLWVRSFAPQSALLSRLAVDDQGNVVAAGQFSGTVDFDPAPATVRTLTAAGNDAFVLKLDTRGQYLFANRIRARRGRVLQITSLAADHSGCILVGAVDATAAVLPLGSAPADSQAILIKYKAGGKSLWVKQWGGETEHSAEVYKLAVDRLNNVFFTTNQLGSVDYGLGTRDPVRGNNTVLGKLAPNGQTLFARAFTSTRHNSVTVLSMHADSTGAVYLGGALYGTADFNLSSQRRLPLTSAGDDDGFVARYSPAGDLAWVHVLGGPDSDHVDALDLDARDRVYVAGSFNGSLDFNFTRRRHILSSEQGSQYIAAYTPSGDLFSANQVGRGGQVTIRTLAVSSVALFAGGTFGGNPDMDPGSNGFILQSPAGTHTAGFVTRIASGPFTSPPIGA